MNKRTKKVVLIVSNSFTNDSRVFKEAKTMASNGFETIVYAINKNNSFPEEENFNGFKIKRPQIETYDFRLKPYKLITQFIPALLRLRSEQADIYHANDLNTLLIAYLACFGRKSKLVYDSHEFWSDRSDAFVDESILNRILHKFRLLQEKVLIKRALAVFTVSDSLAGALSRKYGINKPVVVKNCPYLAPIPKGNKFADLKTQNRKVVLYQGYIAGFRGLSELTKSAIWYKSNISLIFLGDGPYKEELIKLIKKLNLSDRVFIYPSVPLLELPEYTASADIGVAAYLDLSLSQHYTLPNKFFEYMHAGVPVAASALPEMRKIVLEERIGEVCDISDPKDIARIINSILSDEKKLKQMKNNAIRAAKKYNWEIESKKLLSTYKKVLEK